MRPSSLLSSLLFLLSPCPALAQSAPAAPAPPPSVAPPPVWLLPPPGALPPGAVPASALPPGALPPFPHGPPPGRIEVSAEQGTLEQRPLGSDEDDDWITACVSPCAVASDPRFEYRIGGDGRRKSRTFRAIPGVLRVQGKTGSRAMTGVGIGLLSVGGLLALGGAMQLLLDGSRTIDDENSRPLRSDEQIPLVGLLAGGLAMGTVGVVMIATNRTQIEVSTPSGAATLPGWRLSSSVTLTPRGLVF